MPSIEAAVQWAINIANDETHGYDQANRNGPDYDCSSFVGHALKLGGGFNVNGGITTRNMVAALKAVGFKEVTDGTRKRGDVFVKPGSHTVMAINSTQIVHASINEKGTTTGGKTGDQTGKEICVRCYYNYSGGWTYQLRYTGSDYDAGDGDVGDVESEPGFYRPREKKKYNFLLMTAHKRRKGLM